jgi:hypothetical protein
MAAVRIRAKSAVLGLAYDEEGDVEWSPLLEALAHAGHIEVAADQDLD